MAKHLVFDYTFDASEKTITLDGIYAQKRLLLITNVTDGIALFSFNDAYLGLSNISFDYNNYTTTLTLAHDTTAMSDDDQLQIFVEATAQTFKADETLTDPVSKLRVSQPENLIDTDFEYGLQSTKWETLELTNNIPTFYARDGDQDIDLSSISSLVNSDVITVTTSVAHGLQRGAPVIMIGTSSSTADGGFLVASIPGSTSFTYIAKSEQATTGSLLESYTQLFPGSIYSGTEFKLSDIGGIITDGADPSTLTVTTRFPTDFTTGTSLSLANTFARSSIAFNTDDVITGNVTLIDQSYTSATATGEDSAWTLGGVSSLNFQPAQNTVYFAEGSLTIDLATDQITFPTEHGFSSLDQVVYLCDDASNTAIAGLSPVRNYWVNRVDDFTISLHTTRSTTLNRADITANGVSGGLVKSAFALNIGSGISNQVGGTSDWVVFYVDPNDQVVTTQSQNRLFATRNANDAAIPNLIDFTDVYLASSAPDTYDYWGIRIGTLRRMRFSNTSTGGILGLSDSGVDYGAFLISNSAPINANSLYFSSHGLQTDDVVNLTATTGSLPTGLVSGTDYRVTVVSPDRISFKTLAGAAVVFTSAGSTNLVYRIQGSIPLANNDTFLVVGNQLSDGDLITYDADSGTAIGGLTSGSSYYVARSVGDRFNLSIASVAVSTVPSQIVTIPDQSLAGTGATTGAILASNLIYSATSHPFSTGNPIEYVSNTPLIGLRSGQIYFVRDVSASSFSLHPTVADASAGTNTVELFALSSGVGTVTRAFVKDLTSAPSAETQLIIADFTGAADGVYQVGTTAADQLSFTLSTSSVISDRSVGDTSQDCASTTLNGFYIPDHGFTTGTAVVFAFSTGFTVRGWTGLTQGATYYVIKVSAVFFQVASTAQNALDGVAIDLVSGSRGTSSPSATLSFSSDSLVGVFLATGTVSYAANGFQIFGEDTTFTSYFKAGDTFTVSLPEELGPATAITAVNTSTDVFTAASHGLSDGEMVRLAGTTAPTDLDFAAFYYVRTTGTAAPLNNFSLHYTEQNALDGVNILPLTNIGTSVTVAEYVSGGSVVSRTIEYVNTDTQITVTEALPSEAQTGVGYFLSTSLLLRSDGFALHRAYDGGAELIPSSNPDSQMIRQTRKYFRYQSGKGIQVSYAVNFSPTSQIDTFTRSGTTGTIVTRFPHRLTAGLSIVTSGATNADASIWNGTLPVASVVDDLTFTVTLPSTPSDSSAQGLSEYYVAGWLRSALRCGLFDEQNGLFFEYDGSDISVNIRTSTQQLSGYATVEFGSGEVTGDRTRWSSQLSKGDAIVIKGQTYRVTRISSDTLLYVTPNYRGIDSNKVIITKTTSQKVPQAEWNLDVCDGTGHTGFQLNLSKIQMAYIDYSWYGAGKVRFGFKDQNGDVQYIHEFVHGNFQTEAYMRSGNIPARYEIENLGAPTYVPALAHWGTSVIMDGRFDNDRAYVFNASSNNITQTGAASLTAEAKVDFLGVYSQRVGTRSYQIGYGLLLDSADANLASITEGVTVSGAGLAADTVAALPADSRVFPYQPYLPSVLTREGTDVATQEVRNLIVLDKAPTATAGSSSTYTFGVGGGATVDLTAAIPLISIRLAPSVDTSTPGFLGEREIINRMQLILQQVGILSTHSAEIRLILNGQLSTNAWERVTNPSLSQLLIHSASDTLTGGANIFNFRASGGTGATARTQSLTTQELGEVATLGNSILGGNGTFPDGPDVLTVVAVLTEDPSTVSATNPYIVSGRISWSESQA